MNRPRKPLPSRRLVDRSPHARAWRKVFRGLACPPHVAGTHYVKEASP